MTNEAPRHFSAFLIVAAGTAINASRNIQKGHNAFPTILGGIAFGTLCVGINDVTKSETGNMLAVIFLLSSFLTNGVAFLDSIVAILDNY